MPTSAEAVNEPNHLQNPLVIGTPFVTFPSDSCLIARPVSEPPSLCPQSNILHLLPHFSKDDTYTVLLREGNSKSLMKTPGPMARPPFDPRQLLDPKGYNAAHRKLDADRSSDEDKSLLNAKNGGISKTSQKRVQDDGEEHGMGNMIERIHNIAERPERPHKKQRTEKDDDHSESTQVGYSGGGKGGEIGEYMRQKREEGRKESAHSTTVVDLTEGEILPRFGRAIGSRFNMVLRR